MPCGVVGGYETKVSHPNAVFNGCNGGGSGITLGIEVELHSRFEKGTQSAEAE